MLGGLLGIRYAESHNDLHCALDPGNSARRFHASRTSRLDQVYKGLPERRRKVRLEDIAQARLRQHQFLCSFGALPSEGEADLRPLYCAFAISSMINDWSGVDIDRAIAYIQSCEASPMGKTRHLATLILL